MFYLYVTKISQISENRCIRLNVLSRRIIDRSVDVVLAKMMDAQLE